MHYFVLYNEKDEDIVGYAKSLENDQVPFLGDENVKAIEITDETQIQAIANMNLRTETIRGTVSQAKVEQLEVISRFEGRLVLSIDLEDCDGDGLPELPADGATKAEITASLVDLDGNSLEKDNVAIKFRITRGTLDHREVITQKGRGQVTLTSSVETTNCLLIASADGYERAELRLEFIPPNEFKELQSGDKK